MLTFIVLSIVSLWLVGLVIACVADKKNSHSTYVDDQRKLAAQLGLELNLDAYYNGREIYTSPMNTVLNYNDLKAVKLTRPDKYRAFTLEI